MSNTPETLKAELKVGDVIQTTFYDGTRNARKYGFTKPAAITAIYPTVSHNEGHRASQSGMLMDLQWPDGFTCKGLDIGWVSNAPKKEPSNQCPEIAVQQFDLFA